MHTARPWLASPSSSPWLILLGRIPWRETHCDSPTLLAVAQDDLIDEYRKQKRQAVHTDKGADYPRA